MRYFNSFIIAGLLLLNLFIYPLYAENKIIMDSTPNRGDRLDVDMNVTDAADITFTGTSIYRTTRTTSIVGGDLNGDGFDDLILSDPKDDDHGTDTGKISIFFGSKDGWKKNYNVEESNASYYGVYQNYVPMQFGRKISAAGDVNGDGYDDILIGCYSTFYGRAYLIYGKADGWENDVPADAADVTFTSDDEGYKAGYSVSIAGDVNNDGYDDILIGAPGFYEYDPWNYDYTITAGHTYMFFGRQNFESRMNDMEDCDVSFIGGTAYNASGYSVSGAGDVNGDGIDDLLIGAPSNGKTAYGEQYGNVYLFFGKKTGWNKETDLYHADVIFHNNQYYTGSRVYCVGDLNGDGYNDLSIEDGIKFVYIFLGGNNSKWTKNMYCGNADVVFDCYLKTTYMESYLYAASGVGDVDDDGYDDIVISICQGVHYNYNTKYWEDRYTIFFIRGDQQITGVYNYQILLANADASVVVERFEEDRYDLTVEGQIFSHSGGGDVNSDGFSDFLIHCEYDTEYLVFGKPLLEPLSVDSIHVYPNSENLTDIDRVDFGDEFIVELRGLDPSDRLDRARINFTSSSSNKIPIGFYLRETGERTGVYRGTFKVPERMELFENMKFSSYSHPEITKELVLQPDLYILPRLDHLEYDEDTKIDLNFYNKGFFNVTSWELETEADFLSWDSEKISLIGTPRNEHIGNFSVKLIANSDFMSDIIIFTINISNTAPNIITENVPIAYEDETYIVAYESDDETGGHEWNLTTDADWLQMETDTGFLRGRPLNSDVGEYHVEIRIDDGNGMSSETEFYLTVLNVNDAPVIIGSPKKTVNEDERYYANFSFTEIDVGDEISWSLDTDCDFLELHESEGKLFGIPDNNDVGLYFVNISVYDLHGGSDFMNYTLEVININDVPEFIDYPSSLEIMEGDVFQYDINATDVDVGDVLDYSLTTDPETDMSIDEKTGILTWKASLDGLSSSDDYRLRVRVFASDDEVTSVRSFTIRVLENLKPSVNLVSPLDAVTITETSVNLSWEGSDPEGAPITYDIYFSDNLPSIYGHSSGILLARDVRSSIYMVDGLAVGKTYYWTVIPHDDFKPGECLSGIFSFMVNTPPILMEVDDMEFRVANLVSVPMNVIDPDPGDVDNMEYEIIEGPPRAVMENNVFKWIPEENETGVHNITIAASDGLDTSTISFNIMVIGNEETTEEKSSSYSIVIIAVFSVIILILLILISYFLFTMKKRNGSKNNDPEQDRTFTEEGSFSAGSFSSQEVDPQQDLNDKPAMEGR